MSETSMQPSSALIGHVSMVVAAYVAKNAVPAGDLPSVISSVEAAFRNLGKPIEVEQATKPIPAVAVKKSVTNSHIISLLDGKPYKSLKRHLSCRGLSPQDYRQMFDLPADYPIVSKEYSEKRSALAKQIGLGQSAKVAKAAAKKKG